MKSIFTSWAFLLLLGLAPLSQAMTLERVNSDLFATGPTVDQDFFCNSKKPSPKAAFND